MTTPVQIATEAMGLAGQRWRETRAHPGEHIPLDVFAEAAVKALSDLKLTAETSPEIASIAARGIKAPSSLSNAEIKQVCASALVQAGSTDERGEG